MIFKYCVPEFNGLSSIDEHARQAHDMKREYYIFHYIVLDQNVNDNAYSTPLLHKAFNMDHKMVMMGIGLYHNTFSHLCVQHQNYPEHDNICK